MTTQNIAQARQVELLKNLAARGGEMPADSAATRCGMRFRGTDGRISRAFIRLVANLSVAGQVTVDHCGYRRWGTGTKLIAVTPSSSIWIARQASKGATPVALYAPDEQAALAKAREIFNLDNLGGVVIECAAEVQAL